MQQVENAIFLSENPKIFRDTTYRNCHFREYNFYKATIEDCIFSDCNFEETNFSKANINNCKFYNCFMQFSSMLRVSFRNCEFDMCDFWHSNLCYSAVKECTFRKTILKALYKDLDWKDNTFDRETIIESCGGARGCCMSIEVIEDLLENSKLKIS